MTGNQGLPVAGYTPQSDLRVAVVNNHKEAEERVLRLIDIAKANPDNDQRWVAVAKTQIEQGFMALNRAVFQPKRIGLPEDTVGSGVGAAGGAA